MKNVLNLLYHKVVLQCRFGNFIDKTKYTKISIHIPQLDRKTRN